MADQRSYDQGLWQNGEPDVKRLLVGGAQVAMVTLIVIVALPGSIVPQVVDERNALRRLEAQNDIRRTVIQALGTAR